MSTTMTNGHKKRTFLSHDRFFGLTEAVRNQRERIERDCHSIEDVVEVIADVVKFPFTEQQVRKCLKLIGVKVKRNGNNKGPAKSAIVAAIRGLYEKLGVECPL